MIGAGSAALRKVMANPLGRKKQEPDQQEGFEDPLANDSINTIIEGEIIPRLLMAHAVGSSDELHDGKNRIAPPRADDFALLPLRLEASSLIAEVDAFLAEGISVDAIFVDLLAPAARKLGEMWDADECDFIDVTMGLGACRK